MLASKKTFNKKASLSRFRQNGMSLVELIVAMGLGMFLLSGLSLIFITMNTTSMNTKNLSELQNTQRISMFIMSNFLQQAGYFNHASGLTAATVFPAVTFSNANDSINFLAGQIVSGTSGASSANSDKVAVRYVADPDFPQGTCSGISSSVNPVVYIDVFSIDASGSLICNESVDGVYTVRKIAENITNMKVIYGIESSPNSGSVNMYVEDPSVFPGTYSWGSIRTITVRLTYRFKDPNTNQNITRDFKRTIGVMNSVI